MSLFEKLLYVFGGRAASTGLEESSAVEERYDREHPCARAQLKDGEQVGEVVTQDVTSDRDRVLTPADSFQRKRHRIHRFHDAEVETGGLVFTQVEVDPADDLGIVSSVLVQPEHGG